MVRLCWVVCLTIFTLSVIACSGGGGNAPSPDTAAKDKKGVQSQGRERQHAIQDRWAKRVERERAEMTAKFAADVKQAEAEEEHAKAELEDSKKKYVLAKAAIISPKKDREFKDQIKSLQARISDARSKRDKALKLQSQVPEWEPRTDPKDLRVGEVAKLGSEDGLRPVFTVLQIIDDRNALLKYGNEVFWSEGLNTSGLSDGKTITLPGVVECPGNRQYTTPLGTTMTVLVIKLN